MELAEKKKSRVLWIDALKGFAILSVVYLHVHNGYEYENTFNGSIIKWLTSFHMILFFMCAGYFFNYEVTNYKEKIQNKFKSLLIPYIVWGLIIGFFVENLRVIIHPNNFDFGGTIFLMLTGRRSYQASWFLLVLFLVYILEYGISCIKPLKSPFRLLFIHIIIVIIGFSIDPYIGSFYKIRLTLISSFFFVIGYLIKTMHDSFRASVMFNIYLYIVCVFIGAVLEALNYRVTYSKEIFGNPVLMAVSSILTVFGLMGLFEIIGKNINEDNALFRVLLVFGKNSIVVLCTHMLFIYLIRVIEKILKMEIHTFPTFLSLVIVCVLEFVIIKIMPKYGWKLFGKGI